MCQTAVSPDKLMINFQHWQTDAFKLQESTHHIKADATKASTDAIMQL